MTQQTLLIDIGNDQFVTVPLTDTTMFLVINKPILSVKPNYRYHATIPSESVANLKATECLLFDDLREST